MDKNTDIEDFVIHPAEAEDARAIAGIYNSDRDFLRAHLGMAAVCDAFILRELQSMRNSGFSCYKIVEKSTCRIIGIADIKTDEEAYLPADVASRPSGPRYRHGGLPSVGAAHSFVREQMCTNRRSGRQQQPYAQFLDGARLCAVRIHHIAVGGSRLARGRDQKAPIVVDPPVSADLPCEDKEDSKPIHRPFKDYGATLPCPRKYKENPLSGTLPLSKPQIPPHATHTPHAAPF
jgi:hypothetical protein